MSAGNYVQNFSDIANWTNNFATGIGASNFASVGIIGTGNSVTNGTRTTKSSAAFVTGASGGIQKGSQTLTFLSIGSSTTPEAVAVDLLLDFTGRSAGTISFDWTAIDNGGGTRPGSMRIFWTINDTLFTEISAAQILDQVSPNAGSINLVSLPTAFNNCSTAKIRFYQHAGAINIGSGSRDKISLDNISITSNSSLTPTISFSATLTALNTTYGTPSNIDSFVVSGSNLIAPISITPPLGFEISTLSNFSSTIGNNAIPITVGSTGTLNNTFIYLRIMSNAGVSSSPYLGNFSLSSIGATSISFPVQSGTVTKKQISISGVIVSNKIYDAGTNASILSNGTYSGLVNNDTFLVIGTPLANFVTKTAGLNKEIAISGFMAPSNNYSLTQPSGITANITQLPIIVNGVIASNKVYDGNLNAVISGGILSTILNNDSVTISSIGQFASANAGTGISVSLTLTGKDSNNYVLTQPLLTANISQANQNISFTPLIGKNSNDAPFLISASASSGLPISFSSSNLSVATVSGNTITIVGSGTTLISAIQNGNQNYLPATLVSQSLIVSNSSNTIAAWNLFGQSSPSSFAATNFHSNLVSTGIASHLTRGPGATSSTGGNSFRTTGFQNNGISTSNTDYFQITLGANNGYSVSLSSIDAKLAGTAGFSVTPGVNNQFAYSLNGTTFTLIGSAISTIGTPATLPQINLSGITDLQNVPSGTTITIRYYASGQTTTGGWGFTSSSSANSDNGISLGGTINAVSIPSISVSPNLLDTFFQTNSQVSAIQTYTLSGDYLTSNVTLTSNNGFELSKYPNDSFGSGLNLPIIGGNIIGEPITIYVRQNATNTGNFNGTINHTSTGAIMQSKLLFGKRTGIFYSKPTGNLNDLSSWGNETDGSGLTPANFGSDEITYKVKNRTIASLSSPWTVSGLNSKVILGDGLNQVDFTIPGANRFIGTIDLKPFSELSIENTNLPNIGNIDSNSTIEFNNIGISIPTNNTYQNLKLSGFGNKIFPSDTLRVQGNLTLNNTSFDGTNLGSSHLKLGGNLTYIGTVVSPSDSHCVNLVCYGRNNETQTLKGSGNTLRWYAISSLSENTIFLSDSLGSSHLILGNDFGGGITLINNSTLNLNGNDLTFANISGQGKATINLNSSGKISCTKNSDLDLFNSNNISLGTLRFTANANTIGNLYLNHLGNPAQATLYLGNALNVTGSVQIIKGTLHTGDQLCLKSTALGTAGISEIASGSGLVGQVIVERFIPSTAGRKYRYLAAPFSTGPSIDSSWQKQIHITGAGSGGTICPNLTSHSNGLDASASNNSSMFTFNESSAIPISSIPNISGASSYSNAWIGINNTHTNYLTAGKGYNVFLRGARGQGCGLLDGTNPIPSEITLSAKGQIFTGDFNFPITYHSSNGEGWNLVGNPYPSAIDWNDSSWVKTNVLSSFWVYDPINDRFATYSSGSGGINGGTNIIASGQAFFVKAIGTPILTVKESSKKSNNSNGLFKTNKNIEINLTLINSSNKSDEHKLILNPIQTDNFDDEVDAEKLGNGNNVNIYSIDNNLRKYAINNLSAVEDKQEKRIKLGIGLASLGNYQLKIETKNLPYFYLVKIIDNYLHTERFIIPNEISNTTFSVNSDSNSYGNRRFELSIENNRPHSTSVKNMTRENEILVYPNPITDKLQIQFNKELTHLNKLILVNIQGQIIKTIIDPKSDETIELDSLASGIYFLQAFIENESNYTYKIIKK